MTTANSTAVDWFLANQRMTSYDPATQTAEQGALESARDYAMAEQTAIERGWWVLWIEPAAEPGTLLAELLEDHRTGGHFGAVILAAMGGIDADATDDWKRAIAAELALEAIEAGA